MSRDDLTDGARRAFRLPGQPGRVDAEVTEELQFHIDERIDELVAGGMAREAAEREVHARFGDLDGWRRETRAIDARRLKRERRGDLLGALIRDARYAWRGMLARPGLTAAIVLTLALTIGATTAISSTVRSVLLRPLPLDRLDRMLVVRGEIPGLALYSTDLSPAQAEDLFARRDLFAASSAYRSATLTLTGEGEPRRVRAARTMGDFFSLFGGQALIGTTYRPEHSEPGSSDVVVLSHGLWQELTGGDPGVVGRTLQLGGRSHEVLGVMPPGFGHPRTARLWLPQSLPPSWREPSRRGTLIMTVAARLTDGVTPDAAREALAVEARNWHGQYVGVGYDPATHASLSAVPFVEYLAGDLRPVLIALLGAVALVLLIACANVASLQLVRAIGRAREIAVRGALGAGRGAIARQLLIESLMLAALGGLAGVAVAIGALRVLTYWAVGSYEPLQHVALDGAVLLVTAATALGAGLLFGLVPAIRAWRVDLNEVLRDAPRGSSGGVRQSRLLQATVAVQMALAVVLLLGASTLVRSVRALLDIDPGFRPDAVITAGLAITGQRYDSPEGRVAFFEQAIARIGALPGVQSAAIGSAVPFSGDADSSPFTIPSIPAAPDEPERHGNLLIVSPGYFATLGVPLVRGRDFTSADRGERGIVAIIDETLARRHFGDTDPIGREISQGMPATIVGVVGASTLGALNEAEKPSIYYPAAQYNWVSSHHVVVRSALPLATLIPAVRAAIAQLDPDVPLSEPRPLQQLVDQSLAPQRLSMVVVAAFATLALLLAALGVHGVISYGVRQREQEIGIRVALGASPRAVVALIVRTGVAPVLAGLVMGLAAFLWAAVLTERAGGADALVYGVRLRDPLMMVLAAAVVLGIAVLACLVPARRAARIPPTEAMRST